MLFAATRMDLEIIILSESSSKTERERQIPYITYMWNLNYEPNELIFETEAGSQIQRTDFGYQRRRDGLGVWD